MPVTVTEMMESRTTSSGKSGSHEKKYTVFGSSDEAAALAALSAVVGTSVVVEGRTFYLQTAEVKPIYINTDDEANSRWEGTARYSPSDSGATIGDIPEPQFAFDTAGGSTHITQTKERIASVASGGGDAPDYEGAIGVDIEGPNAATINGADILTSQYQFRETHYFADADVTQAYKVLLADLTNTTNNASFRGFAIGEVLFLGASGQRTGDDANDLWQITFSFAVQRNPGTVVISPTISLTDVQGWHYVWVTYGTAEHAASGTTVRRPVAAYVDRVYEAGDFSGLDLGGS